MSSKRPRPAGPHPAIWFLCNLGPVLLVCVGYFAMFSPLWGPPRPWKWLLAISLVPALSLGLDLRGLRIAPRRRKAPGGYEAQARADWPWWRRLGAAYAGVVLIGMGVGQSLGIEVDIVRYPLVSGLCIIISLGIGIPLLVLAWPRERWRRSRRRRRRRTPARHRKVGSPMPGGQDAGRGTSMHIPTPQLGGFSGVWGGFGSRPAHKAWTPKRASRPATSEPVPARFRGLHLLRRAGLRRTRAGSPLVTIALGMIVLVAAALITYGCVMA